MRIVPFAIVFILSWGVGCADAGNPGVYAEVATYAAELQQQIDS